MVQDRDQISFSFIWISSFSNTIYWKDYCFPNEYYWHNCQKLVDHIYKKLFLGIYSVHWSMGFYASILLFWLLYLYNLVWNQKWSPSAMFFFLRSFRVIWGWGCLLFHMNFRIFLIFLWKLHWNFDSNCIESTDGSG